MAAGDREMGCCNAGFRVLEDEPFEVDLREPGRLTVELCYPERDQSQTIEIGLTDVRAADSIRISYDFARDGWSIQQASVFEWDSAEEIDPGWLEVAFVRAWASKKTGP